MTDHTSDPDSDSESESEAVGTPEADGAENSTATISGDEGMQVLAESVQAQEAARERELTEAEKQKRRIMRDRGEVDPNAPPVTVTFDDYEFAFTPYPQKVRTWIENTSFEFLGLDEDSLADDPERGAEMRAVKDKTASLLAEHARAAAYDEAFWADWFGVEERMRLINLVLERQDRREGNRR